MKVIVEDIKIKKIELSGHLQRLAIRTFQNFYWFGDIAYFNNS